MSGKKYNFLVTNILVLLPIVNGPLFIFCCCGCEVCRLLTSSLLYRTNTSAVLLWRPTCPSCWLFWASGTSTSSRQRLTPYCPMTSTCTALPPTSSRSESSSLLKSLLNVLFHHEQPITELSLVVRVTWNLTENTSPKMVLVSTTRLGPSCGGSLGPTVSMLSTSSSTKVMPPTAVLSNRHANIDCEGVWTDLTGFHNRNSYDSCGLPHSCSVSASNQKQPPSQGTLEFILPVPLCCCNVS